MTRIDYSQLRQKIKETIDRETCKELLESLGVDVGRDYRFKDNDSFSIDRNGNIKDFGSTDFSGDIIAFMIDVLGTPPKDATEWTAKALGVWDE